MKKNEFTHVDTSGNPKMVDVSEKESTRRTAAAQAIIKAGRDIVGEIRNNELITKKGPVFQTAIIAGVMAAKKTSELIPFCHPIAIENCQVEISSNDAHIIIKSTVSLHGKTGVEMEAMTAVTVAALTVYDMCKALSHDITIEEVKLLSKTGGKKDFASA